MDTPVSNVLGITVQPKTVREQYKRHEIIITYLVQRQAWRWTFKHTMNLTHTGTGKTLQLAIKKAREQIDIVVGEQQS